MPVQWIKNSILFIDDSDIDDSCTSPIIFAHYEDEETENNVSLCYGQGNKDSWCVYIEGDKYKHKYSSPKGFPFTDEWWAGKLAEYARKVEAFHPNQGGWIVYEKFIILYDVTQKNTPTDRVKFEPLEIIYDIVYSDEFKEAGIDSEEAKTVLIGLYMSMVSEYYYTFNDGRPSVFEKRIKRIVARRVLIDKITPEVAVKEVVPKKDRYGNINKHSKGTTWMFDYCKKNGFKVPKHKDR